MKLAIKLYLEKRGEFVLGPGRLHLLRSIRDLGSLRKAAQELGMSYRWAWGRMKAAEDLLQTPLLARTEPTAGGRPKVLTPEAVELLAWYEGVEKRLSEVLNEALRNRPEFLRAPEEPQDSGQDGGQRKAGRKAAKTVLD